MEIDVYQRRSNRKIEVNGTKRGIIEPTENRMLCERCSKGIQHGLYGTNCVIQPTLWRQNCCCFKPSASERSVRLQVHVIVLIQRGEKGNPIWEKCYAGDLSMFPSVRWKMQNIQKLKESNPEKYAVGIDKLKDCLFE